MDAYLERTRVTSVTSSYADGYERRRGEIDRSVSVFVPQAGQIGVAAFRGATLLGMDVFGSSALYARACAKVLRGLLAEVSAVAPGVANEPLTELADSLGLVARAEVARGKGPGGGETLHGASGRLVVGAVVSGGRLYHAVVAG